MAVGKFDLLKTPLFFYHVLQKCTAETLGCFYDFEDFYVVKAKKNVYECLQQLPEEWRRRSLKFGLSFCTVFLLACRAGFVLQKAQSYTNRQPPFLTRPNSLSVSTP